jgi:hypothetical protein
MMNTTNKETAMQTTTKANLSEVDLVDGLLIYLEEDEEVHDRFATVEAGNPTTGFVNIEFDEAKTILKERFGKVINGLGQVVPVMTVKEQ